MSPFPIQPDLANSPDLLSPKNWPKSTVWHYTNAAGLAGVIQENVLWASSTAFMNDHHELRTGADLFRDLFERHKVTLDPKILENVQAMAGIALVDRYKTFVACACTDPNNLTMWRNYTGPEVGFAVGIDSTKPLFIRRQKAMTQQMVDQMGFLDEESKQEVFIRARENRWSFKWREAVYDPGKQVKLSWGRLLELESTAVARSEGRESENIHVVAEIFNELQTFKDHGFKDEREMRIVCSTSLHADLVSVKYRPSRYGIVPYVELCLPAGPNGDPPKNPEPVEELPIVGIAVGPTPYPEEAAAGAREFLRSVGRESIPVVPSKIPFRW
ncbi:DUF2971 domain-containing protein [Pseudarthrobacter raffinosi]|uniref:DUF2971 domain-containing protein n=1 Tax=Pseudarthrobacter raffinosi TaxID=2953651 RepID=UPI00208F2541|nr:DUF2971 domain-containing protein [Pseudarthrobacter sp. MDT3-9]MCO4252185.1 hypothetical protein [Pseudarthrobacter sp. MDT3-9]